MLGSFAFIATCCSQSCSCLSPRNWSKPKSFRSNINISVTPFCFIDTLTTRYPKNDVCTVYIQYINSHHVNWAWSMVMKAMLVSLQPAYQLHVHPAEAPPVCTPREIHQHGLVTSDSAIPKDWQPTSMRHGPCIRAETPSVLGYLVIRATHSFRRCFAYSRDFPYAFDVISWNVRLQQNQMDFFLLLDLKEDHRFNIDVTNAGTSSWECLKLEPKRQFSLHLQYLKWKLSTCHTDIVRYVENSARRPSLKNLETTQQTGATSHGGESAETTSYHSFCRTKTTKDSTRWCFAVEIWFQTKTLSTSAQTFW